MSETSYITFGEYSQAWVCRFRRTHQGRTGMVIAYSWHSSGSLMRSRKANPGALGACVWVDEAGGTRIVRILGGFSGREPGVLICDEAEGRSASSRMSRDNVPGCVN